MVNYRRGLSVVMLVGLFFATDVTADYRSGVQLSTIESETQTEDIIEGAPQGELDTDLEQPQQITEGEAEHTAEGDTATTTEQPEAEQTETQEQHGISVMLNGVPMTFTLQPQIINGTSYLPLTEFFVQMGCTVEGVASTNTIQVTIPGTLNVTFTHGSNLVVANNRYFLMDAPPVYYEGFTMVPARTLATIFSSTVSYDYEAQTIMFVGGGWPLTPADLYYNQEDLMWLARIINAESRGESLDGKIAVGNVVLNRVESSLFPNTVEGVIFDREFGIQFTPAYSGSIYKEPTEQSVIAAKLCLEGIDLLDETSYYFLNLSKTSPGWIERTKTVDVVIGNHTFFMN